MSSEELACDFGCVLYQSLARFLSGTHNGNTHHVAVQVLEADAVVLESRSVRIVFDNKRRWREFNGDSPRVQRRRCTISVIEAHVGVTPPEPPKSTLMAASL